ncbi:allantoate amidohydrolase [Terracidiphilus gabretensis]|uniref:allantoate amidohydrolase n=1 Tax=Terracidiphilus gabretensis TaxID=1577687 RepID=UPI00071B04B4|nr:allantoate amidohydrolase [Terracidiphilus gabretensis]
MHAQSVRAISECHTLATFTEEPAHITRRFLTPPVHAVHTHLRQRMEALGMTVQTDAAGNLRGIHQPANAPAKRFLIGSHIDTVPDAGPFDGILGVTLALELVEIVQERQLPLSIEVIAFSEEEGVRYGIPFLGSRAVAGTFDEKLLAYEDADGIPMSEAIRSFGLDPTQIPSAAIEPQQTLGFLEIHIEQGPILEAEDLQLAAVTSIVGQTRGTLTFTGHANHAGTTPMHLRHDALAAAAEWITAVETHANSTPSLVATVGKIFADPNATNVIPGTVHTTLDLRHPSDPIRTVAVEALIAQAQSIAQRRGLTAQFTQTMNEPAIPMDLALTANLTAALESTGLPARILTSGAGHDAMILAARIPTTMLFLRSPGGISHHPAESVREQDVEAALHVAANFLERIFATINNT